VTALAERAAAAFHSEALRQATTVATSSAAVVASLVVETSRAIVSMARSHADVTVVFVFGAGWRADGFVEPP
jgi:hypothetical protein